MTSFCSATHKSIPHRNNSNNNSIYDGPLPSRCNSITVINILTFRLVWPAQLVYDTFLYIHIVRVLSSPPHSRSPFNQVTSLPLSPVASDHQQIRMCAIHSTNNCSEHTIYKRAFRHTPYSVKTFFEISIKTDMSHFVYVFKLIYQYLRLIFWPLRAVICTSFANCTRTLCNVNVIRWSEWFCDLAG